MCKVKTGKAVCDMQDVQNLVTGIICRQTVAFDRTTLMTAVYGYLKGSSVATQEKRIEGIIDATLSTCVCSNILLFSQSQYAPRQVTI